MLDLKRRGPDVRRFVATLEEWIIRTLAAFNVRGERREDRIGVWVRRPDKGDGCEDKIAAIGIRVTQWVTLHGIALNVEPELSHFAGIVPCGVIEQRYGVTSLADLGLPVSMADVDMVLRREFEMLFGRRPIRLSQVRKRTAFRARQEIDRGAVALIKRLARRSGAGKPRSWRPRRAAGRRIAPRQNRRGGCAPNLRPALTLRARRKHGSRRPAPDHAQQRGR